MNAESHRNDDTVCPTRGQLAEYALGRLSKEQAESLWSHVASCPTCQAVLQSLDGLCDDLTTTLRGLATPECEIKSREVDELADQVESLGDESHQSAERTERPPLAFEQLGDYQILESIGRGGMGVVYKARHVAVKEAVALKVLAPQRMHNPRARARFRREMKALEKLDHPNIVRAHRACEADGRSFLVKDLLKGADLSRLIGWGGPISTADACEVIRQAAIGLQHAHEKGLVHRDVKPSNLMLTADGTVKLLDLGLARLQSEAAEEAGSTRPETNFSGSSHDSVGTDTGHLLGSLDYMAPEQRWNPRDADARADVYSLGCTLYFLLTGRPPTLNRYHERSRACGGLFQVPALSTFMEGTPHEIPQELSAVLDRMTARLPEDRFSSAADVSEALASLAKKGDVLDLLENWQFRTRATAAHHCAVLGVDVNASRSEIQEAYRKLPARYHPNVNPNDPYAAKRFRDVRNAYEMLCEPWRQERKGAFHTAVSAFLTVHVYRPRRQSPLTAGGIGPPLIVMATVFYLVVLCVSFVLGGTFRPVFEGIFLPDAMMTTNDNFASEDSFPLSRFMWEVRGWATLLYVCFVIIVLRNTRD